QTDLPAETPRVIVIAVKPQVMGSVLAMLKPLLSDQSLIVSIADGISIARFVDGLGSRRIVRTMPNTPAQLGKGITGAFAAEDVTGDDRALAQALLEAAGEVVWLDDEADIDSVTAVSGSGP